jgi:Fe-S-cluster formation regulator IscX/YfhJ
MKKIDNIINGKNESSKKLIIDPKELKWVNLQKKICLLSGKS